MLKTNMKKQISFNPFCEDYLYLLKVSKKMKISVSKLVCLIVFHFLDKSRTLKDTCEIITRYFILNQKSDSTKYLVDFRFKESKENDNSSTK